MANETQLRRPLGDHEIREGVAVKCAEAAYEAVYEAVKARMEASGGRLYGMSYPSFRGKGTIELAYYLDWRGEVVPDDEHREKILDNHPFQVTSGDVIDTTEGVDVTVPISIPEVPPNIFRKETGQGIPVLTQEQGKTVEKKVRYQPRKKSS